jgi:hypothetical protein
MEQKAAAVFRVRIHIDLTLLDPDPHWDVDSDSAMKLFYLYYEPELFHILFF